jgi:hypothetical protein
MLPQSDTQKILDIAGFNENWGVNRSPSATRVALAILDLGQALWAAQAASFYHKTVG